MDEFENEDLSFVLTEADVERRLNAFTPRPYQLPILKALDSGYRRVLAVLPRRAGKDITALNYMIRRMWETPGVYYYIFPTYAQAKKVIWDSITIEGKRVLDYFPKELIIQKNSQEMKIRMRTKGGDESLFQLIGSDNFDSLMGTNPRGCVFSEYALQDPQAYQYISPILAANGGWALFISTPRGRNHLWALKEIASNSPDWFYMRLSIEDTGHISMDEIDREKREGIMSEDMIQQEYYCFPPGQEVLCADSLCPIEEIRERDLVIGHSGRPRAVLEVMERDYEGELVSINSHGSYEPIVCTPGHPVRVYSRENQSYEWVAAAEITPEHYLVYPKLPTSNFQKLHLSLVRLMAWYICDGSSFQKGLQFTVREGEKENRVAWIIGDLGLEFKRYPAGGCVNLVVNNCALVDFLKGTCGSICYNKHIPFSLIEGYEEEFFSELMKGDGCEPHSTPAFVYSTTSKVLAYQVQRLAISLSRGLTASVGLRPAGTHHFPDGREGFSRESYNVAIYDSVNRKAERVLGTSKYGMVAKVRSADRIPYSGTVHNLKVQYDESYVVGGRSVHNCSFSRGIEGAYYAKYIDEARRNQRIGAVPWESAFPVHTAWDIGVRDSTCIIFFQTIGQTVRIIDYYENSKEGIEHYVKVIDNLPYTYGKHIAPHDIRVREWGSGITRIEKARQLGVKFTLADDFLIPDGIEAGRSLFSRLWIDEKKCADLIKSLENYRQEYDAKRRVYKPRPLHDWASHASDAYRYLAVSLPKTRDSLSADELNKRFARAVQGSDTSLPKFFQDPNVGRGF